MSQQVVDFSDFSHWVNFEQISLWISAFTILFAVVGWNILGRVEYHFRFFTRLFNSKFRGCYVIALYIFCFSFYRNLSFVWAINDQVKFEITNVYLYYFLRFVALSQYVGGIILVFTSSWALGILGTYNGDYFRILMEERITHFPFSILSNPMYVGSSMLFFARAISETSPCGILLSIWAALVYKSGTVFEEPFTAYIYSQAESKKKKKQEQSSEISDIADGLELQKDFQEWTVEEVVNWLDSKGFAQYKETFYSNHVNGSVAFRLDLNMLKIDLGITSLGHRFQILDLIQKEQDLLKQELERLKGNKWISERKAIEDMVLKILEEKVRNFRTKLELAELKLLGKKKNTRGGKNANRTFWVFKKD